MRVLPWRIFTATVVAALLGAALQSRVDAAPCVELPERPAGAAALKPAEVLLAINAPRAGETVVGTGQRDSVSLGVDYWGPRLVPGPEARAVDDYHLAFFVDEDPSPYLGTLLPIPRCNPRIVHTASTRVTFDDLPHGSHALAVVLAGSNNVAVNPPVAARVTFMVR
jgi:hypothetical protein